MKNLFLTILSFSLFVVAKAQPSLTAVNNIPVPGDSYTQLLSDSNAVQGNSGENITWNFNTLATLNDTGIITTYMEPSATPYAANFPTANLAVNITAPQTNEFNYYKTSATDWQEIGTDDSGLSESYTDPQLQFTYPFTYGTIQTDNYAGVSDSFTESGTVTKTGDAYGTLLLQGHTYNNVLRIKVIDTSTTIQDGFPVFTLADTAYYWCDTQRHYPLLSIEYSTLYFIGIPIPFKEVLATQLGPAGVAVVPAEELHFNLYPNPGKGIVYAGYTLAEAGTVAITVTNVLGQSILQQDENMQQAGAHTVAFNNLAPGIYTVQLKTGNTITAKKLIIGE